MKSFEEHIGKNYLHHQKLTADEVMAKNDEVYSIFRDWTKELEEEINALEKYTNAEVGLHREGVTLSATYNDFIELYYEIDRILTDNKMEVSVHFALEHNDIEKPDATVLVPYVELLSQGYAHYNHLYRAIRYALKALAENPEKTIVEVI